MADLSSIVSSNSFLPIEHPATGREIGLTLEIIPPDSEAIKARMRQLLDRRKARAQRNQPVLTVEDERASLEICKTAVVGWQWTDDADGSPGNWGGEQLTFNPATLSEMLSRDWLREQVDRHLADAKSFFSK